MALLACADGVRGFGMFALEMRATGELIGFTGLVVPRLLPEVMTAVEIGWRLARLRGPRARHRSAAATLRFGLIDRNLGQIISIAQVGNGAPERIVGKLGMRLARESVVPTCDRPVRVYAITKAQYLAAGPRSNGDRTARRHVSVLAGKVWVGCVS